MARPEVLAKLHPDLPRVWRQTFMQVVGMNAIWTMAGQPPCFDETLRRQLVDLDHEWDQGWAAHRRDLDIPDGMPLGDAEQKDFVITASAQGPHVNTLVVTPGTYTLGDLVRVGVPFRSVLLVLTTSVRRTGLR